MAVRIANGLGSSRISGNLLRNLSYGVRLSSNTNALIVMEENTLDQVVFGSGVRCEATSTALIRNNVIANSAGGVFCVSSSPIIECNNVYQAVLKYGGDCSDQTGINGNISVDPRFCGIPGSGNYYLQSNSPCAPGHHPDGTACGQIGAFGVACGSVATKETTWGGLKALYRDQKR
jgi:hypothetical protein